MSQTFQAENGELIVAQDDVQAAAFENAGLKPVGEAKGTRKQQSNE